MDVLIRELGLQSYEKTLQAMQQFTDKRDITTVDELWCVQHPAVFTLGKNSKLEHLINTGDIAVVQSDRGGQVTFHAPGQQVIYVLLDLTRRKLGVRDLVTRLENTIIELLTLYNVASASRRDAPGVYVENSKIAALGLRVRKGRCYHGMALNVDMDLSPYDRINPCGYEGLKVTQMKNLVSSADIENVKTKLVDTLVKQLQYDNFKIVE